MQKLNCLIIEDQIPAQETLKGYIDQVPTLNLLNAYISPLEALKDLDSGVVDVLFLDIHLPKLSGIELIKSLQQVPQTILTTAFSEYAIDGFDLDVVDYLLKPFSFERFIKAISKIQQNDLLNKPDIHLPHLFIRNKGQINKIVISETEYVEAKGDFVVISTNNRREIANTSLQNIRSILGENFIQCHKSFIININAIDKIIGNHIIIKTKQIPIGRTYKSRLIEKIKMI